jgi:hypothetical protein
MVETIGSLALEGVVASGEAVVGLSEAVEAVATTGGDGAEARSPTNLKLTMLIVTRT